MLSATDRHSATKLGVPILNTLELSRKGDNLMNNLLLPGAIKSVTALFRGAVFFCGFICGTVHAETPPDTASPQDVPVEHQTVEDATTWDKTKEVSGDAWDATKDGSAKAWDKTKEVSGDAWDATKEGSAKAWDKTKEVSGDAWDATKEGSAKAWESTKEMTSGSDTADEEAATENQ